MFFIDNKRFVVFATLLFCSSSYAELTLQSSSIFVESNALVIGNFPFPGAPRDRQGELVENFPGVYDKVFTAVSAIDGAENVATTRANVSLSTTIAGVITATGTSSASTSYTKGGSSLSKGAVSNGTILFRFSWTSDGEVLYRFERTLTRSATGIGTSGPFGCDGTSCPPSEPFVFEQVLPAGTNSAVFNDGVRINGETGVDASAEYNAVWSITITELAPCELAWASASAGAFDEAGNWDPQVAPGDDNSGCNNLIFDQAGAYEVTFDDGASANSMRVLSGTPALTGGLLTLSGADVTDGLSISNEGQLTLNAGTITARGIGVGVAPPTSSKGGVVPASLLVKADATLSSLTSLDIARQPGTNGLLTFEGGAVNAEALVTVQGDATFGAFGKALVLSSGTAKLSVLGDLTLGQFSGSAATLDMVGASDPEVLPASLAVGGTLTVANEGQADIRLAGLFDAKLNAARVGALAGSDGLVNVKGGPFEVGLFEVAENLVVGGEGKGAFVLGGNAEVSANSVILGADDGATGTLQAAGKGGKLKARQNILIGDEGRGVYTLSDGASMEAASLIVSSNPGVTARTQDPSRFNVDGRQQPVNLAITGEIIVGAAGSGEIEMLEDTVIRASELALGVLPGSSGVVFFLGGVLVESDSNDYDIVLSDTVSVGVGGEGLLATRDSGFLRSRTMSLGVEQGGFGRFSAAGELNQTEVSEILTIGDAGRGELSIESAVVFAGACQIGAETGGLGLVQIQFGGELNIADELETGQEEEFIAFGALQVGGKGPGLVELFDDGTVLSCSVLTVGGVSAAANGTLNIASGAIAVSGNGAFVGSEIEGGPGIVRVGNGGAMQIGGELLIGPNGLFIAGAGSNVTMANILVAGQLAAGVEVNIDRPSKAELVSVKGQPGPSVFDGDMEIAATGSLEVAAGAGEALIVSGAATLDGKLEITLQPGATFTDGQLLDLINFQGGTTGSFASVVFLNAPEGFEGAIELEDGTLRLRVISGGTVEPEGEGEGGIEGEGQASVIHSADQDSDERISLSELLRVIQFYNALGLHCVTVEGESEDGYIAGANEAAETCAPHDSDFAPQDWTINLSELLQLIQLYNANGYEPCEAPEGFCTVFP